MGAFGDKLRKQREQRGIALDAISNTTKISTRMLRALEDEHFDQLPGGVFNKGFVRAYARQVGLDEEEAITDYLAALRESQVQQQSILPDFRAPAATPQLRQPDRPDQDAHNKDLPINDLRGNSGSQDRSQDRSLDRSLDRNHPLPAKDRRREDRRNRNQDLSQLLASAENPPAASPLASRFREKYPAGDPAQPADQRPTDIPWGKLAVALLILTLALAVWNSRRHDESAAHSAAAAQPSPVPSSAPVSASLSTATQPSASAASPSPKSGKKSPPATLPAGTPSTGTISTTTAHPTPISAPPTLSTATTPSSSLQAPASASSPENITGSANKPAATPPAANPSVAQGTATAAAKPPAPFTLLIRAEKTTWVSIVADGKPVTQETLIAPAHTSVRATAEVVVKIGNAAGVSFQLNGKEFPAQGNDGEVKTYIFDATGIRPPQAQPTATNQ